MGGLKFEHVQFESFEVRDAAGGDTFEILGDPEGDLFALMAQLIGPGSAVDRGPQGGKVAFDDVPYSIGLDFRVSMDDDVPRANGLAPWDIRCQVPGLPAQLPRGFANYLDVSLDGGLQILVAEKTCEINA